MQTLERTEKRHSWPCLSFCSIRNGAYGLYSLLQTTPSIESLFLVDCLSQNIPTVLPSFKWPPFFVFLNNFWLYSDKRHLTWGWSIWSYYTSREFPIQNFAWTNDWYFEHYGKFTVAIAAGYSLKYQSFVYGSFVWEIHVRYDNIKCVNHHRQNLRQFPSINHSTLSCFQRRI